MSYAEFEHPSENVYGIKEEWDDEEYSDNGAPLEIHGTHELARELLTYIRERQEVMRLLKIHPMAVLPKRIKELVETLENLYPEVEKPVLQAKESE
jgi:hypothetical protein